MHISFERSGGFAGLRVATEVDTASLPEEEARVLEQAVEQARFFDLPGDPPAFGVDTGADRFQYVISVQRGGQSHTVTIGESRLPESMRPLVERLEQLARTRRR